MKSDAPPVCQTRKSQKEWVVSWEMQATPADTSTPEQGGEESARTFLCVPSVPPLLSSELAELESDCRNASDCRVGRFEPDEPVRSTSSATAATPMLSATARLLGLHGNAARV